MKKIKKKFYFLPKTMEKDEKKQKIIERRLNICYKLTSVLARPVFKLFYNFDFEKPVTLPKPAIILANHTTDYDPLLLAGMIKNQFYFLASENCFRKGTLSKFLVWAYNPISKIKGASDTMAVLKTLRYLKEGKSVCIFPEGGRTFNGRTNSIEPATGKLVKVSGASLVTARIVGGYMTIPRWGFGRRKGRGKGSWGGKIVNVYSPEQLKSMSPKEITDLISKDLYVDAYELQKANPIHYKGKDLAYGMECGVCVCPSCRTIGSIKTKGDSVFCTNCGISTTLNDYGFFEDGFIFKSYGEWDEWQEGFYRYYVNSFENEKEPLVYDDGVSLRTINAEHETKELGTGRFSLYKDRFAFEPENGEKIELPVNIIPDSSVFSRTNFNFTDDKGLHYELYTEHLINDRLLNVRKYHSLWKLLRTGL